MQKVIEKAKRHTNPMSYGFLICIEIGGRARLEPAFDLVRLRWHLRRRNFCLCRPRIKFAARLQQIYLLAWVACVAETVVQNTGILQVTSFLILVNNTDILQAKESLQELDGLKNNLLKCCACCSRTSDHKSSWDYLFNTLVNIKT